MQDPDEKTLSQVARKLLEEGVGEEGDNLSQR